MIEVLAFHIDPEKDDDQDQSPITIENVQTTTLENVGAEMKALFLGEMKQDQEKVIVNYIERTPEVFELDDWIKNWKKFRNAGLPVPPTLLRTNRDSLLVTNFKAEGGEMYGKGMILRLRKLVGTGGSYQLTDLDTKYMELVAKQASELRREATSLAGLATAKNLILPRDDAFELLVNPDGSWKLVITDLSTADEGATARQENGQSVDRFIMDLEEIDDLFKEASKKSSSPPST